MINDPKASQTFEYRGTTMSGIDCLKEAVLSDKCVLPDAHYHFAINTPVWWTAVEHLFKALRMSRNWEALTLSGRCWLHLGDLLHMDIKWSNDCHKEITKQLQSVVDMKIANGMDDSLLHIQLQKEIPSRSV